MSHVPTVVRRIVDALPVNTNHSLEDLECDAVLTHCSTTLVELSRNLHDFEEVLHELLGALTYVQRGHHSGYNVNERFTSQLYLLRIVSACSVNAATGYGSQTVGSGTVLLAAPLVDRALACAVAILGQPTFSDRHQIASISLSQSRQSRLSRADTALESDLRETRLTTLFTTDALREQEHHLRTLISFISAMNWSATFGKLATTLRQPYIEDFEDEFNQRIRYMAFFSLTLTRLDAILVLVNGVFTSLQKSTQLILVECLSKAVSIWIDQNPSEINHLYRAPRRALAADGVQLFETLLQHADSNRRRAIIWPLLAVLVVLYPGDAVGPSGRAMKKALFLQNLNKSLGESRQSSTTCFVAYAQVFQTVCGLAPELRQPISNILNEIIRAFWVGPGQLRDCASQIDFTAVTILFSSFFRMNFLKGKDFATSTIVSWLQTQESHHSKILAVKATELILSDPTESSDPGDQSRANFTAAVSPLIRALWISIFPSDTMSLADSTAFELSAYQRDLLEAVLSLLCAAPEIINLGSTPLPIPAMDTALVWFLFENEFSSESTIARYVLEIHKSDFVEGYLFQQKINGRPDIIWQFWLRFTDHAISVMLHHLADDDWTNSRWVKSLLIFLVRCVAERVAGLKKYWSSYGTADQFAQNAKLLETLGSVLLMLSCNVEVTIAVKAAKACSLVVTEREIYKAAGYTLPSDESVFSSLARETFLTVGRNSIQKKIRNCLRSGRPTYGLYSAWSNVYARWCKLADQLSGDEILSAATEQRTQMEWQNYIGFLTSAGRLDDTKPSDKVLEFISRFTDLFMHQHKAEFVSEASAETLGSELHLSLFLPLLQVVQSLIATMKDKKGFLIVRARNTMLAEHLILICRGLFDRIECYLDVREDLSLGDILLDLAGYLELCGQNTLRPRLRFSQLCEVLATKFDLLCITGEKSTIRRLCNYIAIWISEPEPLQPKMQKISNDTSSACLRALARMSIHMRLAYEPLSQGNQIAADVQGLLNFALPLISMSEERSSHLGPRSLVLIEELLRNVLSTNQRATFTSYLSLCYNPNANIRHVFTAVILSQLRLGISALQSPSTGAQCETLWNMISSDRDMTTALLDGSFPQHNVTETLLELFRERSSPVQLFTLVVDTEIQICTQESELYRRNSPTTRLFAAYAKHYATSYVEDVIRNPMKSLASRSDDYSMEIDVTKITVLNQEELAKALETNRAHLQSTAQEFIDAICTSATRLPFEIAQILRVVAERTALKFPGAVQNSVGSFLILRLLGPAIMTHPSALRSARMRRQVVVIVKLLTNLANNTFFKEQHLAAINDFLRGNVFKLSKFLVDVSSEIPNLTPTVHNGKITSYSLDAHFAVLHRAVFLCHDRIKLKWIEISLNQGVAVAAIKKKLGIFKHLVSQFGPPRESQVVSQLGSINSATSSMSEGSQKQAPPIHSNRASIDVIQLVGFSQGGRPLICLQLEELQSLRLTQIRSVLQEFSNMMDNACPEDVEVLIDATGFRGFGERPNWKDQFIAILADETFQNCHSLHFYNCNAAFLVFFDEHINNRIPLEPTRIRFLDLSDNLEKYFEPRACARLSRYGPVTVRFSDALSLSKHGSEGQNCSMKLNLHAEVLFLISVQKYEVIPTHKSRVVECLPLADIKNVQVGDDFLVILLKDQTVLRLEAMVPEIIASSLRQAIQTPSFSGIDNERTNSSEDRIHGLLLCLAFVKLGSTDGSCRESGARLLRVMLKGEALSASGLGTDQTTDDTRLDYSELRQVHRAAYSSCNHATRREFLHEILMKVPELSAKHSRSILYCLDIWLEETASGTVSLDAVVRTAHIKTVVMSLVSIHSSSEDTTIWEVLWRAIARQETASDLVLESLTSYAILFRYTSTQVQTISQILRIIRGPSTIRRLAEMLMAEIMSASETGVKDLASASNWHEIEVVLLLLVHSAARTSDIIDCLPEIFFSAMVLFKLGTRDVRHLTYQLVLNTFSSCIRAKDPQSRESIRLVEILEAFSSKQSAANFVAETGKFLEGIALELFNTGDQNKEILAADFIIEKIEQMVEVMKLSAISDEQEIKHLTVFFHLVTDNALRHSCLSKRTFLALGVMSADLGVQADHSLAQVLVEGLEEATMSNSRHALAVVMCLIQIPFDDLCHNMKLGIALCMSPMSSLASAGLRMLHLCFTRLMKDESGSQVLECCLKADGIRWHEYEAALGLSLSIRPTLGICCILLQALKVTNSLDLIKKILLLLVKIYQHDRSEQFDNWFQDTLPPLALLCALTGTSAELRSVLVVGKVEVTGLSKEQSMWFLFPQGKTVDRELTLPLALMLARLLATTRSEGLQSIILTALNDTAHACPDVFQYIYYQLHAYLKRLLATSINLPCLGAAQEMIQRHQELNRQHSSANSNPIDRELVKSLGFEFLLKPHDAVASEEALAHQKQCFENYLREEF